jgi:aromatic ring-opening dioxygenase catalytic subunit (LigB family)
MPVRPFALRRSEAHRHEFSQYANVRAGAAEPSRRFDAWLTETVTAPSAGARNKALFEWEGAPAARVSHPREEHLLSLMVTTGVAGNDLGVKAFEGRGLGATVSGFRFG